MTDGEDEIEENFLKALLITIGWMALFTLLIFIPLIGFMIVLTFGAYTAGYKGGRYSVAWRKLGLLAAVIWSTVLLILLLVIISSLPPPFKYDIVIGGLEIALISFMYAVFIIFCVLGARASFKERAVYV